MKVEGSTQGGPCPESAPVQIRIQGEMATITLNRPEVHNCGNPQLIAELVQAAERVRAEESVRVVVLRGNGRSFSSGIDLKVVSTRDYEFDWFRQWERAVRLFEEMEKVTIAAIHGYCLGGGLQLALACDLRVVCQDAILGLPAALEGLVPGLGPYRLAHYIGLGRAKWLTLTGEKIDAWKAHSWGLADVLVRREEFDSSLWRLIRQLIDSPVTAQIYSKKMLNLANDVSFEDMMENYLEWQHISVDSADHARAAEAYRKTKRLEPVAGGRR
jgi:enoyl-CoA hydratase